MHLLRFMRHHSRTACVVSFRAASASLQNHPAMLFGTHLNRARNQIFHIECSGISTGDWGDLDCCWSSKEVLIHVGRNLAPPFQSGLYLERKTQHYAQLLDPDAYPTFSLLCIRMRHRVFFASCFPFLWPIL